VKIYGFQKIKLSIQRCVSNGHVVHLQLATLLVESHDTIEKAHWNNPYSILCKRFL